MGKTEKIEKYRAYIENIIREYGSFKPSYGDVEMQILSDKENNHYQLNSVGWNKDQRIHGCLLHIDLKNGKIWIQHDGTEEGAANKLVEMGVPKEDIVFGFHAPYKRQYTDFAIE